MHLLIIMICATIATCSTGLKRSPEARMADMIHIQNSVERDNRTGSEYIAVWHYHCETSLQLQPLDCSPLSSGRPQPRADSSLLLPLGEAPVLHPTLGSEPLPCDPPQTPDAPG
jgi:hypothetical protein